MAEGGGPGNYKHNPTFQRALNIGMRVLGGYLVYKGTRQAITRRSVAGAAVALGGLQLLSGNVPTYGNPLISSVLSHLRT